MSGKLTRRDFLSLSALATAGTMAAACSQPVATPQVVEKEVIVEKEVTRESQVEVEKLITATPGPTGKVQVAFWSELVGSKEEGRAALLNAFNAASDSIEVVHEPTFGSDETAQKFLTAVTGGVVPDLLGNDSSYLPGYADIDALTDLGPFMDGSDTVKPESFPPGVLSLCEYNGKVWGIPVYADTMVLYYNKDLMQEAGLDPESPPRDWDSLREAAIAMTKRDSAGNLEVAGCLLGSWSAPRIFVPMLYAWGGSMYNSDVTEVAFNSDKGKELLGLIVDFVQKDKVTDVGWGEEFEDSVNEPFVACKAGMQFDCPAATKRIVRWRPDFENWGIVGLPGGPNGFAQTAETIALMIPAGAKNKEAAWRVIEYWMQPKVMVRFSQDVYRPPSTVAALEDEALMSDPRIAPVSQALENTVEIPQTTKWAEVFNALSAEVELAILGEKEPGQALDDAAATANQALLLA